MGKCFVTVIVLAMAVLLSSTAARAEGETKFSVGLKTLASSWDEQVTDTNTGTKTTTDFTTAWMVGPTLGIKFSNGIFASATYLTATSPFSTESWDATTGQENAERSDTDLLIGYMFTPRIGAYLGGKIISIDITYTNLPGSSNLEESMFGVGMVGNIPLSRSVALYGNVGYLWGQQSTEYHAAPPFPWPPEVSLNGPTAEIGLIFVLGSGFSANVGFKGQWFEGDGTTPTGEATYQEDFQGLSLGLTYTF